MNVSDARKAHKILDDLFKRKPVLDEEREFLRSTLPERPKQKTLEELIALVYDAWTRTSDNEWSGNIDSPDVFIEDWLSELYVQLQGLKGTPAAVPALPAGMRIADHEVYGRAVVSPGVDDDGTCKIFYLSAHAGDGSDSCWVPIDSLTFVDVKPAVPAHHEFLETEADYQNAPEGTIVALDGSGTIWLKKFGGWRNTAGDHGVESACIALDSRRVLRWGK